MKPQAGWADLAFLEMPRAMPEFSAPSCFHDVQLPRAQAQAYGLRFAESKGQGLLQSMQG